MKTVTSCGMSVLAVLVLALATIGCPPAPSGEKKQTPATQQALSSVAAKQIFAERCSTCHGTTGQGDGPGSAALTPKPRNYTDKAWQASVTDEQIKKTILYGGAAVGKSLNMPSSPDLDGKPEVLDGLVKIVRGFGN